MRTEANHRLYAWGGDLLTHFHFHYAPIDIDGDGASATVRIHRDEPAAFSARFRDGEHLLATLPFADVDGLRTELCDLFHAFSVHPRSGRPGRVSVERTEWPLQLVEPVEVHAPWMTEVLFPGACTPSHGVYTWDVPYRWTAMQR